MLRVSRFHDTLRTQWPWLILEFLVVVAGVSLSFLLQDWRDASRLAADDRRLLADLRDGLATDAENLELDEKILAALRDSHALVLDDEARAAAGASALDLAVDRLLTYRGFTPDDTAYRTFGARASASESPFRDLFAEISALHEQDYRAVEEWAFINKDFVLRRIGPYFDQHAVHVPPGEDPLMPTGFSKTLPGLLERPVFRNLVRTGLLYDEAQLRVVGAAREKARRLVERLGAALGD